MTKGFITVATGSLEYYELAYNLLMSYKQFTDFPLPFALLCDTNNNYSSEFDEVIILDKVQSGYLNKLSLAQYLPYDETIFIDADCLAFGDLNSLFDCFEKADDISCFGRVLPLNDKTGWFEFENLGEYQNKVSYVVGLHGGIYFMRNTDICRKVFSDAKVLLNDYQSFRFKGNFSSPGDEPLIVLSMAINQCKPIPFEKQIIVCFWECVRNIKMDISTGMACVLSNPSYNAMLVHWGTRYTRELEYKKQISLLKAMQLKNSVRLVKIRYSIKIKIHKIYSFFIRGINKIKRIIGRK